MKKVMIVLALAIMAAAFAEDKVWPANYWQTVTNMVTAATPAGSATANQAVSVAGDVASTASSTYSRQLEARIRLLFGSANAVADFSSLPPGTMISIR